MTLKVKVNFGGLRAVYVWRNIFAPVFYVCFLTRSLRIDLYICVCVCLCVCVCVTAQSAAGRVRPAATRARRTERSEKRRFSGGGGGGGRRADERRRGLVVGRARAASTQGPSRDEDARPRATQRTARLAAQTPASAAARLTGGLSLYRVASPGSAAMGEGSTKLHENYSSRIK